MAYGDFDFRLVLGSARPALASAGADADGLSSAGIQPLFRCGRPALKSDRAAMEGDGASCRVARSAGAAKRRSCEAPELRSAGAAKRRSCEAWRDQAVPGHGAFL